MTDQNKLTHSINQGLRGKFIHIMFQFLWDPFGNLNGFKVDIDVVIGCGKVVILDSIHFEKVVGDINPFRGGVTGG